jgi:hypothetical protein
MRRNPVDSAINCFAGVLFVLTVVVGAIAFLAVR